jgi:hypothetical protein
MVNKLHNKKLRQMSRTSGDAASIFAVAATMFFGILFIAAEEFDDAVCRTGHLRLLWSMAN